MEKKVGTNNPLVKGRILIVSCSLIGVRNGTPALVLSEVVLGTVFFTWSIFPLKEKRKSQKQRERIWMNLFFQPIPHNMFYSALFSKCIPD